VSGLVAGAVALGGLAISGGSVSAKTPTSPTTNRISGDDRYETAVAVARDQLGSNTPTDGLVIASGETPYDSLAGSVLTLSKRPMVLVKKDSIPESVSDFIADYKSSWATGSKKIYVLGGTAAISSEVFDAIKAAVTTAGSLTPPSVTRIEGTTRYETAKKISEVTAITDSGDTMIIANGEDGRWADALSAAALSAEAEWPIITTTGASLNEFAKAAIDAYLAKPGSAKQFLLVGGPLVISDSIVEYLVATKAVPAANVRRVGGADRYQTSLLMNLYIKNEAGLFAGQSNVALVSGAAPWDALASAGWAAHKNSHVMLTPPAGGNVNVATLATVLGATADAGYATFNDNLYIIGGKAAVSDAAKVGYSAVSSSGNLTSTLTGCEKGRTSFTLTLSGAVNNSGLPGQGFAEITEMTSYSNLGQLTKNVTTAYSAADAGIVEKTSTGTPTRTVFTVSVGAAPAVGDVITWKGWTEGVALGSGTVPERSIGSASCTVTADTTPPVITFKAVTGSTAQNSVTTTAGQKVILQSSEKVTLGTLSAANKVATIGASSAAGALTATDISGGAGTSFLLQFADGATAATAGDAFVMDKTFITDVGGLNPSDNPSGVFGADAVGPAAIAAATECDGVAKTKLTAGGVSFESTTKGAAFNSYTLAIKNQSGLLLPTIAIDNTAKTIVVTVDSGDHKVGDVITAARNAGIMESDAGTWDVTGTASSLVTTTLVPATVATGVSGTSSCQVLLLDSEGMYAADGGITVNVAGLNAGYISAKSLALGDSSVTEGAAGTDIAAAGVKLATAKVVLFTTTVLGAGTIVGDATANGLNDASGNNQTTPISFTIS